jgi:hypothetical protein
MPQPKVNQAALREIEEALDHWLAEVEQSHLSPTGKSTYADHPSRFVRWLKGEYQFDKRRGDR